MPWPNSGDRTVRFTDDIKELKFEIAEYMGQYVKAGHLGEDQTRVHAHLQGLRTKLANLKEFDK